MVSSASDCGIYFDVCDEKGVTKITVILEYLSL